MRRATILAASVAIAGCAPMPRAYWWKGGITDQMANGDLYQCRAEAAAYYPPAPTTVMVSAGVQAPQQQRVQTDCRETFGGQIQCTSRPVGLTPAVFNQPPRYSTVDANEEARDQLIGSCMRARGYQIVHR